ncbi:Tryptophan synthase alpha chain [Labilithrix luteola]|uniref:Tryptophan synthase alpha chain n=1 Tax=Labilithrix luteola TaxID=1391654 RepID=A0A0K1Q5H9_9BACT|nr:hypothetical protein [Labilithrix luteola]AKV01086.1 Tryptophan synthase alpha chain [Labilithrix luteola]
MTFRSLFVSLVVSGFVAVSASSCASEGECRYNSDCLGSYCSDGTCKKDCVDATIDCPRGYVCNGVAQCEPGSGISSETVDGGGEGGTTIPPNDSGTKPGDDGGTTGPKDSGGGDSTTGPGAKVLLDKCTSGSDCASGVCETLYVGGPKRCTKTCASTSDCMQGTRCVDFNGQSRCAISDVGRTCTAANQCNSFCLINQKYCTVSCQTGADCPNGYGCQAVGASAQRVCVKAEAPCGDGVNAECIAPVACDETGLVSSCTLACNSAADCPQRAQGLAPWTCDGVCRRPGDVYGPLAGGEPAEYACNGVGAVVNICNDAQHMNLTSFTIPNAPAVNCNAQTTTSGAGGDTCVDSCRYQGGCAFGFACTALGSIGGNRIGLCLPSNGKGEIGDGCGVDSDCFFGHCNRNTGKCSRDCTVDGLCTTGSTCSAGASPNVEGKPFRRCE